MVAQVTQKLPTGRGKVVGNLKTTTRRDILAIEPFEPGEDGGGSFYRRLPEKISGNL
jgi:hypothetical protein